MAGIFTLLAKEKGLADEDLEEIFYNEGTNREASSSPEEVYQKVNDSCLDGMPCDRVNALIDNTSDSVQWERTIDLHGEFFEEDCIEEPEELSAYFDNNASCL